MTDSATDANELAPVTGPDISVLICTAGRPDSLAETLACLAASGCDGLAVEVVVVDNGAGSATRDVVESARGAIPLRYLHEPQPGKGFGLNTAFDQPGLGDIVVILDDDMSAEPGWWHGVKAICDRHPECDFFTGRSHVQWPHDPIPGWAGNRAVQTWAFSILDCGPRDYPFPPGEWPSGNMFWIRRRVIDRGYRFDVSLYPNHSIGVDAEFILRLAEDGLTGVAGPDAVAAHRVQPALLELNVLRDRAARMGRALANVRLDKPRSLPQARLLRDHPLRFRCLTAANLLRWTAAYLAATATLDRDTRIAQQLNALVGIANNREALRYRATNQH